MQSLQGCVVEANDRADGGTGSEDLGLSVELRPSRVWVTHVVELLRSDLLLVTEFLQDSVICRVCW